jgi:hypothetical protein
MTPSARLVLADCRGALSELTDGVQGTVWRRRWIIAVVLLRAVGHVLHKVDGITSAKHTKAIAEWWSKLSLTKPSPEIFWLFIEEERNNILKEYQTNAGQGVTLQLGGSQASFQPGEAKVDPPGQPVYHYTMNAGYFKDQDQRELIAKAIQWWEQQLDALDAEIARKGP